MWFMPATAIPTVSTVPMIPADWPPSQAGKPRPFGLVVGSFFSLSIDRSSIPGVAAGRGVRARGVFGCPWLGRKDAKGSKRCADRTHVYLH